MKEERKAALEQCEKNISYLFQNMDLLNNALVHRSFVNENPTVNCSDNERLEFLGDAVLELCISHMLMHKFPDGTEGQLSKLRASLVNEQSLARLAGKIKLGDYLLLGKGEEASGGREKVSLLANTFEALAAAVYIDGGFDAARAFVDKHFASRITEGTEEAIYRDYKTALQEAARNRFKETPRYSLIGQYGPDHNKVFEMKLVIPDVIVTCGTGKNKKEAEQRAAKRALELLQEKE